MLTFNLKKEWFEKIKSGEKTHEYRVMSEYWIRRIHPLEKEPKYVSKHMSDFYKNIPATKFTYREGGLKFRNSDGIVFCLGYPSKDDKEKRLYAKIKSICINVNGNYTDLKIDKPVFDIEFELIKGV